ncbi:MAG: hypothetical protein R2911_15810 [Caldilineaceae bacterium]
MSDWQLLSESILRTYTMPSLDRLLEEALEAWLEKLDSKMLFITRDRKAANYCDREGTPLYPASLLAKAVCGYRNDFPIRT